MSEARSLGLWSGILLMKDEMEDRKDSMLKEELNATTSATKLGERRRRRDRKSVV